jgi:acyl-CoA thioesterase FadM
MMFERRVVAGWSDMDFNSHMRNTAYLDKSADVRMMYFSENGFSMQDFMRLRLGPVIMRDELEYYREVSLLEDCGRRWNWQRWPQTVRASHSRTASIGWTANAWRT